MPNSMDHFFFAASDRRHDTTDNIQGKLCGPPGGAATGAQ
jgi:hypothetical protein